MKVWKYYKRKGNLLLFAEFLIGYTFKLVFPHNFSLGHFHNFGAQPHLCWISLSVCLVLMCFIVFFSNGFGMPV